MAGEATPDNVGTPRVRVAPQLAKATLVVRRALTPDEVNISHDRQDS